MDADEHLEIWHAPDKSFTKYIVETGNQGAAYPTDWARCCVEMSICDNYPEIDLGYKSSNNGDSEIKIGTGLSIYSEMIDKCLESMRSGELCVLVFKSSVGSESLTNEHRYRIKLKSIKNNSQVWDLSSEDKMDRAKFLKNQGTEMFRFGDIDCAFKKFSRAAKYLIMMYPCCTLSNELLSEYKVLKCQCYLNLAACQAKYKQWQYIKYNCDKALEIDDLNVKGLFRRGNALLHVGDLPSALNDVNLGLDIEPLNKSLLKLKQDIIEKQRIFDAPLAEKLSKMFSQSS